MSFGFVLARKMYYWPSTTHICIGIHFKLQCFSSYSFDLAQNVPQHSIRIALVDCD